MACLEAVNVTSMQHGPKWDRGIHGRIPTITLLDDRRFVSEIMELCSALKQFVGGMHSLWKQWLSAYQNGYIRTFFQLIDCNTICFIYTVHAETDRGTHFCCNSFESSNKSPSIR